jgi:hypothetical protein
MNRKRREMNREEGDPEEGRPVVILTLGKPTLSSKHELETSDVKAASYQQDGIPETTGLGARPIGENILIT